MSRSWTDDQRKAIDMRGSNILVSAAAGSGKTAVLVERIIKLITEENSSVENMLIVTFTKAAAQEMKERIMSGISSKLGDEATTYDLAVKLRKEMVSLQTANISTLHSFCNELLNSYFFRLGLSPDSKVGDSSELQTLRSEALHAVLDNAYSEALEEGDSDFLKGIDALTLGSKVDESLREMIMSVYEFIMTKPDPFKWLDDKVAMHESLTRDGDKAPWIIDVIEDISQRADFMYRSYDELIEDVSCHEKLEKLISLLENERDGLDDIMASRSRPELAESIRNMKFDRMPTIRDKDLSDEEIEVKERVKDLRDAAKASVKAMVKSSSFIEDDIISHQSDVTTSHVRIIARLVRLFKEEYDGLKAKSSLFDYSDLEHKAISLLKLEDVRLSYVGRFSHIFVDEYQDTNEVQEHIISTISRGNNVFMVGDLKQSIYRFRLADPDIFSSKYDSFREGSDASGASVDLSMNFRSTGGIIDAVNSIFSRIMTRKFGGVDYDGAAALNASPKEFSDRSHTDKPFTLTLIEMKKAKDDDGSGGGAQTGGPGDDEEKTDLMNVEAEAIAAAGIIRRLVDEEGYRYRDIAILSRSIRKYSTEFAAILKKWGVPVFSELGESAFQTLEIRLITDILQVIDNAGFDVPLLSAMRSPFGGFTVDEMLLIGLFKGNARSSYFDIITRLALAYSDKTKLDEEFAERFERHGLIRLKDKVTSFHSRIMELKKKSEYTPIHMLIWEIVEGSDLYYFFASLPGGRERAANISLMIERASSFESNMGIGLMNFIAYIKSMKKNKMDLSVAKMVGEGDDVVKMMTIHKSKGLEFPVVINVGLGNSFNVSESRMSYSLHKDLGIGLDYVNMDEKYRTPHISNIAIKQRNVVESKSEEMRVLYVALTRPIERYYGIGAVSAATTAGRKLEKWSAPISEYSVKSATSFSDWLAMALIHGGRNDLIDIKTAGELESESPEGLRPGIPEDGASRSSCDLLEKADGILDGSGSSIRDEVEERISFRYREEGRRDVPNKVSVTALPDLVRAIENGRPMSLPMGELNMNPRFMDQAEAGRDEADFGNMVHKALQFVDLDGLRRGRSVSKLVSDMVARGVLDVHEEAAVSIVRSVEGFLSSPVGVRMALSPCVRREKPFVEAKTVQGERVLLQGVIDCYFEEGDELVLLDYKTGGARFASEREAVRQYEAQLIEYRDALKRLTGKDVRNTYLCLLDRDWYIEIE